MAPELIDLDEAARRFGIGRPALNQWIREGRIPADLVRVMSQRRRYLVWDPSRLPGGTLPAAGDAGQD
jgi:hypothetical protein